MTGNYLRISGMASGMDIDSLVQNLMKAERTKVDKLLQKKTLNEWKQNNYNDVNKLFANFVLDTKKDFGLTMSTTSGTILNTGVASLDWIKSASISDSDVADVKAYTNSVQGSYEVNVTRLAENWASASSANVSVGDRANLATQLGLQATDRIKFTIAADGGRSVTIDKTNLDTVEMSDIVNEINRANIGVTAVYDGDIDRFFLQTTATGASKTITITDESVLTGGAKFVSGGGSLLKLQYQDSGGVSHDVVDGTYSGVDALFDFGAALGITRSSNNFTINNISFTLKNTGAAAVKVNTNVSGIYEKVNNFVTKYNELINSINTELSKSRYSDYHPLTDEQRESMSEKQIEQWETKAKSGLLKNDDITERILQSIRAGMYQEVKGTVGIYDQLTEIGITTEGYTSGSRGGKLAINKAKLTAAIEADPNSVVELLFKEPDAGLNYKSEESMTSAEITQKRQESGLVGRLYDNIVAGMKTVIEKAGVGDNAELYRNVNSMILLDFVTQHSSISMMDKEADRLVISIDNLYGQLDRTEERYYSQFTAMETALQRLNEQSSYLSSLSTSSGS